jgi:acyl carrier protein
MNARKQHTVERLIALACQTFGKDAEGYQPTDDFFDALAIDSLQAMELLSGLEEEFGVEIPDYELQDVRTFAALADIIGRRL